MKFITMKTNNGQEKGEISFYCRILEVSCHDFCRYVESLDKPWKYEALAPEMEEVTAQDECNDTYGYVCARSFTGENGNCP